MRTRLWARVLAVSLATGAATGCTAWRSPFQSESAEEAAGPSGIAGDPEAGEAIALKGKPDQPEVIPCQSCHGPQGRGDGQHGFPRLAGLSMGYLVKQLRDFAAGERANSPVMTHIAQGLSEQERRDVSAYYARQKGRRTASGERAEALRAQGKRLALRGQAEAELPACTDCHGPRGQGMPPRFPRIKGQHARYLQRQLADFARGKRANDPYAMMRTVAEKLSPEQREAVAAYFRHAP